MNLKCFIAAPEKIRHLLLLPVFTCLIIGSVLAKPKTATAELPQQPQNQQTAAKNDTEIRPIEFGNLVEREIQTAQVHTYQTKGRAEGVLRVRLDADARDAAFDIAITDVK